MGEAFQYGLVIKFPKNKMLLEKFSDWSVLYGWQCMYGKIYNDNFITGPYWNVQCCDQKKVDALVLGPPRFSWKAFVLYWCNWWFACQILWKMMVHNEKHIKKIFFGLFSWFWVVFQWDIIQNRKRMRNKTKTTSDQGYNF